MKQRLLFVTNNMEAPGGTNRVVADVVTYLSHSCDVHLVTLEGGRPAYYLPPAVRFTTLQRRAGRDRVRRMVQSLGKLARLRRLIRAEQPHAVVSFLTRANLLNALIRRLPGGTYRSILCERNFNSIQYGTDPLGRMLKVFMRLAYPSCDVLIANAKQMADDLHRHFAVPRDKLRVIYNPFDLERLVQLAVAPVDDPWFLGGVPIFLNVARLIPQKDQPLLLRAFARVRQAVVCRLALIGEGPLLQQLQQLAAQLGVTADVRFLGWQDNPFRFMRRSSAFVLTSRFEGFPNVPVEAMAVGCPVIATACPSGPAEIIRHGESGLLVPVGDEVALAAAMQRVATESGLAADLATGGRRRAAAFDQRIILREFSEVICGWSSP